MTAKAFSCRVVPFSSEHTSLVADLQRHLWSPDPLLNASYLEWKYLQNPYIPDPLIYLAFVGNKLVGMRGAFGACWEFGTPTQYFILPCPDDLVIHPDFRKRGIHRIIMTFALGDLARRGYRYVVNLSASPITKRASLNMRWRDGGSVETVHRRTLRKINKDLLLEHTRTWPIGWRWADRSAESTACRPFHRFDTKLLARDRQKAGLFAQVTPRTREMSELVERLPRDGRIRHVRDETFFRWRFKSPMRHYRFLYAGDDRLTGYIVLHSAKGVEDRVHIVDWEAENDSIREDLLSTALRSGRFPEVLVNRLGASAETRKLLGGWGFKPVAPRHEHSVLTRSLSNDQLEVPWVLAGRRLDDARHWDMRMIYSMAG